MYSIGSFNFISMNILPVANRDHVQIESRVGVDGHWIWSTGTRGQIMSVQTVVDLANIADAISLFNQYESAIGDSLSVQFAGAVFTSPYDVLDVRPETEGTRQVLVGIGGLLGTSNAVLVANWQLIQVNT